MKQKLAAPSSITLSLYPCSVCIPNMEAHYSDTMYRHILATPIICRSNMCHLIKLLMLTEFLFFLHRRQGYLLASSLTLRPFIKSHRISIYQRNSLSVCVSFHNSRYHQTLPDSSHLLGYFSLSKYLVKYMTFIQQIRHIKPFNICEIYQIKQIHELLQMNKKFKFIKYINHIKSY